VAAFLDVPIPSMAFIPPSEYWQIIRSICDKYGVLLILDCVQSGFGRFGKWFACENYDIVPDIMVLAKALAGSYLPISATIVRKEIAQKFEGGAEVTLKQSYTFEGHPVTCAAALANIEIMESENVIENSKNMGRYLFEQLQSLNKYKIVGDIRGGLGLNCRVELVRDKETKQPLNSDENARVRKLLKKKLMSVGLFGLFANPVPIMPPLVVNQNEIDEIVNGFDKVIGEIQKEIFG
jgi:adenosylmethionine-8-amino-7-oxononanoate aminotransferase